MAAATATVIAVGAIAGAMSSAKAASAAKKTARFNQGEAERARQMEQQRVDDIRHSPGASFAPFGFDAILNIFGNSMAGKMSGFDVNKAKEQMGIGQWNDYDSYNVWRQGQAHTAAGGKIGVKDGSIMGKINSAFGGGVSGSALPDRSGLSDNSPGMSI